MTISGRLPDLVSMGKPSGLCEFWDAEESKVLALWFDHVHFIREVIGVGVVSALRDAVDSVVRKVFVRHSVGYSASFHLGDRLDQFKSNHSSILEFQIAEFYLQTVSSLTLFGPFSKDRAFLLFLSLFIHFDCLKLVHDLSFDYFTVDFRFKFVNYLTLSNRVVKRDFNR